VGRYKWTMTFNLEMNDGTFLQVPEVVDLGAFWSDYNGILAIVPTFSKPDYQFHELVPGWNQPSDPNRFDVVFISHQRMENVGGVDVFSEVPIDDLQQIAEHAVWDKFGLLSTEPFRSNPAKFNFWILDNVIPHDATLSWTEARDFVCDGHELDQMAEFQEIVLSFSSYGRRMIPAVVRSGSTVGGKTCAYTLGVQLEFPYDKYADCAAVDGNEICLDTVRLDRVFTHEMAHMVGGVDEGYNSENLFDHSQFKFWHNYYFTDHWSHFATYYSPLLDPEQSCNRIVRSPVANVFECAGTEETRTDCEAHAGWRDLLGNGCGLEGEVDCTPADPLFRFEVTCENFGSGRGIYKASDLMMATSTSIMGGRSSFLDVRCTMPAGHEFVCDSSVELNGRHFGQGNERQLCVFLDQWTGSAAGVCNELCLDRCADGYRCIHGTCMLIDDPCGGLCDTGLPGNCAAGQLVCRMDDLVCEPIFPAIDEVCDGKDNDCDGTADEDLGSTTCGLGVCEHSQENCINGVSQTCDPLVGSSTEVCDGLDNDCDGQIDEGVYVFGGFLKPINYDGSSIFKAGRTIPVKVILTDCFGESISTAEIRISLHKVSDAILGVEEELEVETSVNATTGNLFRFDETDGLYIFNLSTKNLTAGTYKVYALPDNDAVYSVNFSLK